jgi:hypothetical protein
MSESQSTFPADSDSDDYFRITTDTVMADLLQWLDDRGYVGILTQAHQHENLGLGQPYTHYATGLLFRPIASPQDSPRLAVSGNVLRYSRKLRYVSVSTS